MNTRWPKISVIIPTINEAQNLPLVFPYLPHEILHEVILVDGRSTDHTVELARQLLPSIKVVLEPAHGKGAALRAGYAAASGELLVVLDADGSHDPREIPRFVRVLLEGADFAKGSRFAPRGGTTDMPRYRKLGNGAFVHLVNLLFDTTFTDLCYGYHAFWKYCLDSIDLRDADGFEIDTAIYLRAVRGQLRIVEVPSFEGYRFYGVGKLRTIPDGWRVLMTIWREWLTSWRRPARPKRLGFGGAMLTAGPRGVSIPAPATLAASQAELLALPWSAAGAQPGADASQLATEHVRRNLQLLYAVSRALAAEFNLRDLLQRILQLTLESVGATSGSIVVLDEQGNAAEGCLLYAGEVRPWWAATLADILERGLASWVVKHRQAALVPSTQADPRWLRRAWDEGEGADRSALGVPLVASDRVIGVLTLVRPQAGQFTEADLNLLTNITVGT